MDRPDQSSCSNNKIGLPTYLQWVNLGLDHVQPAFPHASLGLFGLIYGLGLGNLVPIQAQVWLGFALILNILKPNQPNFRFTVLDRATPFRLDLNLNKSRPIGLRGAPAPPVYTLVIFADFATLQHFLNGPNLI